MEEQEKTTQELDTGMSLYDLNKSLVQKNEIKLNEGIINSKKEVIKNFLRKTDNKYYMLLCNDRKDYTVFTFEGAPDNIEERRNELINILVDECLVNRGEIRGIDLTQDQGAIEIWMSIEDDSYVYYFFPYDNAIIEV